MHDKGPYILHSFHFSAIISDWTYLMRTCFINRLHWLLAIEYVTNADVRENGVEI